MHTYYILSCILRSLDLHFVWVMYFLIKLSVCMKQAQHGSILQVLRFCNLGHNLPPLCGWINTFLERILTPVPHVTEHCDHDDHRDTTQSMLPDLLSSSPLSSGSVTTLLFLTSSSSSPSKSEMSTGCSSGVTGPPDLVGEAVLGGSVVSSVATVVVGAVVVVAATDKVKAGKRVPLLEGRTALAGVVVVGVVVLKEVVTGVVG